MDDQKIDYRNRFYQHYVSKHLASFQNISIEAFENQRVAFRSYYGRYLPKDKKAGILDIGCGYGSFLYHLQKEGYTNAAGVDISPEQVALARELGVKSIECADLIEYLKKKNKEFECITAFDVVEHFKKEELLTLLDAIYSALKPGGVFIMQSPNADGPFGSRYRYWDFTHEVAFTKTSVNQVLSAVGFNDVEVCGPGPVIHGVVSGIRWVIWKVLLLTMQLYLLVETGTFTGHILTQNLIAVGKKQ